MWTLAVLTSMTLQDTSAVLQEDSYVGIGWVSYIEFTYVGYRTLSYIEFTYMI